MEAAPDPTTASVHRNVVEGLTIEGDGETVVWSSRQRPPIFSQSRPSLMGIVRHAARLPHLLLRIQTQLTGQSHLGDERVPRHYAPGADQSRALGFSRRRRADG
jgi:hypothetical protein